MLASRQLSVKLWNHLSGWDLFRHMTIFVMLNMVFPREVLQDPAPGNTGDMDRHLDFKKAFVSVPHTRLYQKLRA